MGAGILLKKWALLPLQEEKHMWYYHFLNVPLSCQSASDVYQRGSTPMSNKNQYRNLHSLVHRYLDQEFRMGS